MTTAVALANEPIVAFADEVLKIELRPAQAEILNEIYQPADPIRTAVLRLGRRSGKSRISSVVAVFESTVNAAAHLAAVAPGEQVAVVVVATSTKQAKIIRKFIRAAFRSPVLAGLIVRDADEALELSNGVMIMTLAASAASARGMAIAVLIIDEAAWLLGTDGSLLDAAEVWSALYPATAQFPDRRILVMSTPRWSQGWYADLCAQAASGRFPTMRTWHRTTHDMNVGAKAGRVTDEFLAEEESKDPAVFRREYLAEFDSGIAAVFDGDLVRSAVRDDPLELAPLAGVGYLIALDPAFTGDTFSLVVGHIDHDERIIVDRVTGWRGNRADPVRFDATLDAIAAVSQAYGGAPAITDQYSAIAIVEGLQARGVAVYQRPWNNESKVDAVAATRRALYAQALEIPDHRDVITELVSLEQRPTPAGRPRIAAPRGLHDDYASALLALVSELSTPAADETTWFIDPESGGWTTDPEAGRIHISPY